MNSIERVTKALKHQEADHVPVYPLINSISRNYLGLTMQSGQKTLTNVRRRLLKLQKNVMWM